VNGKGGTFLDLCVLRGLFSEWANVYVWSVGRAGPMPVFVYTISGPGWSDQCERHERDFLGVRPERGFGPLYGMREADM